MKYTKWIAAFLLAAMMLAFVPAPAAQADTGVKSVAGNFAAISDNQIFLILPDETGSTLYSLPVAGGTLTLIDSAAQIDEVFAVGGTVYYLSYNGSAFQVNSRAADGSRAIIATFASPQVARALTWYEDALYCLVDSKLTRVGTDGIVTKVSDRLMENYCIADGIVYYQSAENQVTYTKDSKLVPGTEIKQQAGCLYNMRVDGTSDMEMYNQGISTVKAFGNYLYFHNLNHNYIVTTTEEEWLDGLLYRINVQTGQIMMVGSQYDWDYRPTDYGMVFYREKQISLVGQDGVETTLYTPDLYSYVAILENCAVVYEYSLQKLSLVPLDGTAPTTVYEGAFIVGASEKTENPAFTPSATTTDGTTPAATGTDTATATTPATGATNTTPGGSILYGASGEAVTAFQKRLVELGYLAKADGVFGDYTLAAVKAFQKAAGLTADGIVGPKTLAAMNAANAPKASAIAVPETKKKGTDGSYIFPDSSKKKLTKAEILAVDKGLWPFARNEIYARHGYQFKNAIYANYFAKKSWYKAGGFSTKDLNEIEWYNMNLLKEMEKEYNVTPDSGSSDKKDSGSSDSYIFSQSSTKKLTKAEIRAVDKSLWPYARNEIYARHGYVFQTKKYKDYFAKKSWYKAGGFSTKDLNEIEWYNMELIKWMEDHEG